MSPCIICVTLVGLLLSPNVGLCFGVAGIGETTDEFPLETSTNGRRDFFDELLIKNQNSNQPIQMSEGRERLIESIFQKYDKTNYPSNLVISFGFEIKELQFNRNYLRLDSWISQSWVDPRFEWNPTDFGGETRLTINEKDIWTPDVTLYNSRDPQDQCQTYKLVTNHRGEVSWLQACTMAPRCKFNFDRSPYEEQTCQMSFGSWTTNGFELDLQLKHNDITLTDYMENDDWELVGDHQPMLRNAVYYRVWEAPMVDLGANLTFQRRSEK